MGSTWNKQGRGLIFSRILAARSRRLRKYGRLSGTGAGARPDPDHTDCAGSISGGRWARAGGQLSGAPIIPTRGMFMRPMGTRWRGKDEAPVPCIEHGAPGLLSDTAEPTTTCPGRTLYKGALAAKGVFLIQLKSVMLVTDALTELGHPLVTMRTAEPRPGNSPGPGCRAEGAPTSCPSAWPGWPWPYTASSSCRIARASGPP